MPKQLNSFVKSSTNTKVSNRNSSSRTRFTKSYSHSMGLNECDCISKNVFIHRQNEKRSKRNVTLVARYSQKYRVATKFSACSR